MKSNPQTSLSDLEQDLPTTREDVLQLRRARDRSRNLSEPFEALQALVDSLPPAARKARRCTAAGRPEFRL